MSRTEAMLDRLGGRTWDELETFEDTDGRLTFADQIRRRKPGGWEAIPVRVRVPRPRDLLAARKNAREYFAGAKLDETKDHDLFVEVEQLAIMALAIREGAEPHGQLADIDDLARNFDEASIRDIQSRINHYRDMLDPRQNELTEVDVFELLIAIKRLGHLGPLVDIAGGAQSGFLLRMADLAFSSPMVQSYAQSLVISTPE